jgi:hypothetical protein
MSYRIVRVAAPATLLFVLGACGASATDGADAEQVATADSKRKCAALTQKILTAAITPPASYASFDLAKGKDPRGLTIDEANRAKCGTALADKPTVDSGGFRVMTWSGDTGVKVSYNLESHVIYSVQLGAAYKGTVAFHSRDGGAFGAHTYEIGMGQVLRDGAAMPIDWTSQNSINELDDALVATFAPNDPPIASAGCRVTGRCLFASDLGDGTAVMGSRDLRFYIVFKVGTSEVTGFYNIWQGGYPDCSTPRATLEAMDYASVEPGVDFGAQGQFGPWIGGLDLSATQRTPAPTWESANAIECNGASVPSPDPGYGAMQWGPEGELLAEFNTTTNVVYKVTARNGYKGPFVAGETTTDSSGTTTTTFSFTLGETGTKNGAPFSVDWSTPTSFTELANAITVGADADCVAAGTCVVTPDDGAGHSLAVFPTACVELTFDKGTTTAVSFTASSQKGK